jgi:hypothetical protein
MATQFAFGKIVTNGLVLSLDAADRNSYPGSGNMWYDLSGNGNHGILTNSPTFDSSDGGAIVFDGVNDYVALTSTPPIAQSIYSSTVEIVAKAANNLSFQLMFGGGVQNTNQGFYFGFRAGNNTNFMYAYYSNDQDGSIPRNKTEWNMYTGTYNNSVGSRYRYFNSQLLSPSENSGVTNTSAAEFVLGAYKDPGFVTYFFNGRISSLKIYNRSLSASEVLQNYNAQKSRFGL